MSEDLISRKALKKAIIKHRDDYVEDNFFWSKLFDEIDNAPTVELTEEQAIDKLYETGWIIRHDKEMTERPQGEWIPCSERLPDDMKKVLVWYEYYRYGDFNCMYQTYGFCYVCDGKWSPFINGETGWTDARIIAWQPLPEPYKKGGAE